MQMCPQKITRNPTMRKEGPKQIPRRLTGLDRRQLNRGHEELETDRKAREALVRDVSSLLLYKCRGTGRSVAGELFGLVQGCRFRERQPVAATKDLSQRQSGAR